MQIPIAQVAAFADGPFTGNPAAVCVLDQELNDALMQAIAAELNLSETAFVHRRHGRHSLRWFTPTCEVDLCGHATLAAAAVLFQQDPQAQALSFATRSGVLTVSQEPAPEIPMLTLDFPAQPAQACAAPPALIDALGATPLHCRFGIDWMAVFANEAEIRALKPNMAALKLLNGRGVIVTAPGDSVDLVSRFFAPRIGIAEDPVTGSAHTALAPYWAERLGKQTLTARQLSARGGSLHCRLTGERVRISGQVVPFLQGVLQLPKDFA